MDASITAPQPPSTVRNAIALVGSPNVGKTSLFNRLTKLLAKTSNFAGTTVELHEATITVGEQRVTLVDLPGLYSLEATSPEEQTTRAYLQGKLEGYGRPQGIVVVVDATRLERTLLLAGQANEVGIPLVVAVNMMDAAKKEGTHVDCAILSARLGCPVVPISARTGAGLDMLRKAIADLRSPSELPMLSEQSSCGSCSGCGYADAYRWAGQLARESCRGGPQISQGLTESLDRLLTHRVWGVTAFALTMLTVFASVFWIAQFPMNVLDSGFGQVAAWLTARLPEGVLTDMLTGGVIAGVGSVLVFLPQICVLFFALTLLEDCGYLSRAVLVVDRWMRKVGLPGQAFVPLLAAHACAIPAIMSTRVMASRRDRLAAILVIPLMTCSARLPVYSMVAAMLFPQNALYAALLFAGAYALGMFAALATAFVLRVTLLPGKTTPLILDLPPYRIPSLTNAVRQAVDRGWAFVRDAGTVILGISIAIWALSAFPRLDEATFQRELAALDVGGTQKPDLTDEEVDRLRMRIAQEQSILGRAGKFVQPVFEPLGFDWRTSVSVLASFAAREVVVSTMAVLHGVGEESGSLIARISTARRADGSPLFDLSTSISLLVFFVLAMQCLPTQAVTMKETGSWRWAALQLGYMTLLAYIAALLARLLCNFFT